MPYRLAMVPCQCLFSIPVYPLLVNLFFKKSYNFFIGPYAGSAKGTPSLWKPNLSYRWHGGKREWYVHKFFPESTGQFLVGAVK